MEINNPLNQQSKVEKNWLLSHNRKTIASIIALVIVGLLVWFFVPQLIFVPHQKYFVYTQAKYPELYKTPTKLDLQSNLSDQEYQYTFNSAIVIFFQSPWGKPTKSFEDNNDMAVFQFENGKEIRFSDASGGWFSANYDQLKTMLTFTPAQLSIFNSKEVTKNQEFDLWNKLQNGWLWLLPDINSSDIYSFENDRIHGFEFYDESSKTAKLYLYSGKGIYYGTIQSSGQANVLSILSSIHFDKNVGFDSSIQWTKYYIPEWKLSLYLPPDWWIVFNSKEGPYLYQNTMPQNTLGLPPSGSVWLEIAKHSGTPTKDFVDQGPKPDISERIICLRDLQITKGIWNDDPNKFDHERLLNRINSFGFTE